MPRIIVKMWPGKSEKQKRELTERIVKDVMDVLDYGEESVSVAMEEVTAPDWLEKIYRLDIQNKWGHVDKKPEYGPSEL